MSRPSPARAGEIWLETTGSAPRGVVLLTHGLNGHPAAMDSLGRALADQGHVVFRPSFHGHWEDNDAFLRVAASHWEEDARRFHAIARTRAAEHGVPLFHVGYSMSGLIFQTMREELRFDRRVLFAPALALHFWYEPAMRIARSVPWIRFRSRIPKGYGANPVSGLRSTIALNEFHRRWNGEPDRVPTLIWCDPRDELVHSEGLACLAGRGPAWQFRPVSTDGCTLPKRYHHLIIDEPSLGAAEWKRVTRETAEFLSVP